MSDVKRSRYAVLSLLVLVTAACGIVSSEAGDGHLDEEGSELHHSWFGGASVLAGEDAGLPPLTPYELELLRRQWFMQCYQEKQALCKELKLSVQQCCPSFANCEKEIPPPLALDGGTSSSDSGVWLPAECTAVPDGGAPVPDGGAPVPDAGAPVPDAGAPVPDAGASAPDGGMAPDAGVGVPGGGDAGGMLP